LRQARNFRIENYAAIEVRDVDQVKSFLAGHVPVIIGAFVDWKDGAWSLNDNGVTDHYLDPGNKKYHAMVAIGYNDDKHAFEVMNSWGPNWNDHGFGWVDYDFWPQFVLEGYVARNLKVASIAPAAGVTAKTLDWLPVGPEGLSNGNWGFPWNVNLKTIKTTPDKRLPAEVKQYLPPSSSQPESPAIPSDHASKTLWEHNGSKVILTRDGDHCAFVYYEVRPAMRRNVSPGQTLFDGVVNGDRYSGTARRFKHGLPPIEYSVEGQELENGNVIELKGQAPIRNEAGKVIKYEPDILRFKYHGAVPGDYNRQQ
jgi:hypothetical protein